MQAADEGIEERKKRPAQERRPVKVRGFAAAAGGSMEAAGEGQARAVALPGADGGLGHRIGEEQAALLEGSAAQGDGEHLAEILGTITPLTGCAT